MKSSNSNFTQKRRYSPVAPQTGKTSHNATKASRFEPVSRLLDHCEIRARDLTGTRNEKLLAY